MSPGPSGSGKPSGGGDASKRLLTVFPWQFRLAKQFIRMRLPGSYRFLSVMDRLGVLDVVVRHRLSETVTFDIPLYRKDNRWDGRDITEYALVEVQLMSSLAESFGDPVIMIDCGADIGILTVMFAAHCPLLKQVWAFEPNPVAFATLEANIARLPQKESKAICAAVANFTGTGELAAPSIAQAIMPNLLSRSPGAAFPLSASMTSTLTFQELFFSSWIWRAARWTRPLGRLQHYRARRTSSSTSSLTRCRSAAPVQAPLRF